MIRRLRLCTTLLATSAGLACIPVYGTNPGDLFCPPDGGCSDAGAATSGGSVGTSTGGANATTGASASGGTAGTTGASGSGGSSSAGTGSTSGGASTGTGTGGSSGGTTGTSGADAGCVAHDAGTELAACAGLSDCACGQQCLPLADAGSYCQTPCTSFDDCNSFELCSKGYCALAVCPDGEILQACTAGNGSGGFCIPSPSVSSGQGELGICIPSGTSSTSCDPATNGAAWPNWSAAGACVANELCGPGGGCLGICGLAQPQCLEDQACVAVSGDPYAGVCAACPTNQMSCGLSCFDPLTDDQNCGGCNNLCAPGTVCLAGRCTRPAPMLFPRYGLAAATGPDGLIYAVGGFSGANNPLGLTETFDPRSNSWTTLPAMPTPRGELGAAWADDGKLHTLGGLLDVLLSEKDEVFDIASQTWSTGTPLPDYRFGSAVSADSSGRLYLAGGDTGSFVPSDLLFRSDPQVDAGWTQLQPMAEYRVAPGGAFGSDNRFYVLGGSDRSGTALASVEAYDAVRNVWDETTPSLPAPLVYLGAAARHGALFAVGGGAATDGGFLGQTAVARLDLSGCDAGCGWLTDQPLVKARGGHAAVLGADGRLYALGGLPQLSGAKGAVYAGLASVEVYDPAQPGGGWVSSVCPDGQMFDFPDAGYTASGGQGTAIATGALTSKGFPDVVALAGSTITPFLNDQQGGLQGGTAFSVDAGPDGLVGLALADVNLDGNLDAIALSPDDNLLFLAPGDGVGGFLTPIAYPTASGATPTVAMAVADFNGDGEPDVAVLTGGNLGILLDKGLFLGFFQGFSAVASYPTSCVTPIALAAADLNGDGRADLVVLCDSGSGNQVNVFLNNGSGTGFTLDGSLAISSPSSLALGDYDLDGLPDIVVATATRPAAVAVFLNQGGTTPTFVSAPLASASTPTNGALSLILGDINGDGYPDILAADATDRTVYLFLNTSVPGSAEILSSGNYATPADSPAAIALTDMRLNGWNDLLSLSQAADSVGVWLSSCPP